MNMFKPSAAKTPEDLIKQLDEPRKTHIKQLHAFMSKALPKLKPYMYGAIIGYGKVPYKSKSGLTGEWFVAGLASQKNYISVYVCTMQDGKYIPELFKAKLKTATGKPLKVGRSCINYPKFEDIDFKVLGEILRASL